MGLNETIKLKLWLFSLKTIPCKLGFHKWISEERYDPNLRNWVPVWKVCQKCLERRKAI